MKIAAMKRMNEKGNFESKVRQLYDFFVATCLPWFCVNLVDQLNLQAKNDAEGLEGSEAQVCMSWFSSSCER